MPQVKKKSFIQKNGLIAVWSMAGFMAMGYIGFLATESGSNSTNGTIIAQKDANPAAGKANMPVQQKLAALTARVEELNSRTQTTSRKVSDIEEAFRPTAALPGQPSMARLENNAADGNLPPAKDKPSPNVSINVLPLTANDKLTEFDSADQLESYGVNIASALSVDTLKRLWSNLQVSNSETFKGLKPHYIDKSTADQPLYLLVAGPFKQLSDARGHCTTLMKVNSTIECEETRYLDTTMENIHTAGRN